MRCPVPTDHLLILLQKNEKTWTIIGAPHKLYNSTIVNTQSNAFRNKWVKAGREAEKATTDPDVKPAPKRKRGNKTLTSSKIIFDSTYAQHEAVIFPRLTQLLAGPNNSDPTPSSFNYGSNDIAGPSSSPFTHSRPVTDSDIEMADTHSESSGRDTKYRGETSTEPNTDDSTATGANIKDEVTLANNAARTAPKENKPTNTAARKKYDLVGISMPAACDNGMSVAYTHPAMPVAYTNPTTTPMSTAYTNPTNTVAYIAPPRTAGHPRPLPLPRIRTAAELEAAEGLLELFRRG
jgi:hypothetical protein